MTTLHQSPRAVEQTGVEYHAISGWAIAALVVGILSAAALIGPLMWSIPALGICLAIVAMWRVSASGGELTGWNLALFGLILSLLFGSAGPAKTITRHYWLQVRAERFADGFLDLLQQNQPYVAQQFTLHPALRKLAAADLPGAIAKDEQAQKSFNQFISREPAKTLLEFGKKAKLELLSSAVVSEDSRDDVAVIYRISPPAEPGARKPFTITLIVERSLSYPARTEQWQILQTGDPVE